MGERVVITGIGLVTPLGSDPGEVADRIGQGDRAVGPPPFDPSAFACPVCARVGDFDAERTFPANKTLRLMNRDARMAAVAAHRAMRDAGVQADREYPADRIALYGATGVTGMPVAEITRLVAGAAGADGSLDLARFGRVALKRVRPVLSFKILANMPICFVSIFQGIRGPNAVYTPWEGQGAQAIAAGVRAVAAGRAPCALVGGCDVKTHEFAFISLQQLGAFAPWRRGQHGPVPGEGAAFLVLEAETGARARGARIYARLAQQRLRTLQAGSSPAEAYTALLGGLDLHGVTAAVIAADGNTSLAEAEATALAKVPRPLRTVLRPKRSLGNLFAAAAAVQVALAAALAGRAESGRAVLANCFGYGSQQGAFVLEAT